MIVRSDTVDGRGSVPGIVRSQALLASTLTAVACSGCSWSPMPRLQDPLKNKIFFLRPVPVMFAVPAGFFLRYHDD